MSQESRTEHYDIRGFLTKDDRELLKSEEYDEDPGSIGERRSNVRKRIRSGLRDFALVFDHLSDRDRELVFQNYDGSPLLAGNPFTTDPDNFHEDVAKTIAFFCHGLAERGGVREIRGGMTDDGYPEPPKHNIHLFQSVLWDALDEAYPRFGYSFIDMDLDIQARNEQAIEDMKENLRRSLRRESTYPTAEAVRGLIDSGEVDLGNLKKFVKSELEE